MNYEPIVSEACPTDLLEIIYIFKRVKHSYIVYILVALTH